jgi:hypothetical protein
MTNVQGFDVEVSYSPAAIRELTRRKETTIVSSMVYGGPKAGTPAHLVSDMGEIVLGDAETEIKPGSIANFHSISLDDGALVYISETGPQLLINVVSGRRSSSDNLLDCGIYEGPLKQVQGRAIPISCKLIGQ